MPKKREFVIEMPCPIDGLKMKSKSAENLGDIDLEQEDHIHLGKIELACDDGHVWTLKGMTLIRVG